jgi:hypothetical protein
MLALLLAVTLSSVAPDPVQTPAALLANRLTGALDLEGPLASQALEAAPQVRVCSSASGPLGPTPWAGALTLAELAPACAGSDAAASGFAGPAFAAFAPPMALWPALAVPATRPYNFAQPFTAPAFIPPAPVPTIPRETEGVHVARPAVRPAQPAH